MITSKCDEEKKTSKQKIAAMSNTDTLHTFSENISLNEWSFSPNLPEPDMDSYLLNERNTANIVRGFQNYNDNKTKSWNEKWYYFIGTEINFSHKRLKS